MSAYIQFFIKGKDQYYPIGTYCRSSAIYEGFDEYVPYENICAITVEKLAEIRENVNTSIDRWNRFISEEEHKLEMVSKTNNSIEEKMEAYESIMASIGEMRELIDGLNFVKHYIIMLNDMIDEVKYGDIDWTTPDTYIYAGIEVGDPNKEDI